MSLTRLPPHYTINVGVRSGYEANELLLLLYTMAFLTDEEAEDEEPQEETRDR